MTTPEPPDGPTRRPDGRPEHPAGQPDGSAEQPPASSPPARARTRWTARRRWLVGGLGVLVLLLVIGAVWFDLADHHRFGHRYGHHHGGHGHSVLKGMAGVPGIGPGGGFGGLEGGLGGPMDEPWDGPRPGAPAFDNTATLIGSVVSVANGTLVVATDGAGQVSVPTTERTRLLGPRNELTGLAPGQRVVVRIGADKSAVAVFTPPAQAVGTITALSGDRATLIRPDGLTEPVDLAAVNPKPANGDLVEVRGSPADNGATLKAQTLRVLPRAR